MKEIELTQGYKALVDDEDEAKVNQFTWCAMVRNNKDGSFRTVYAQTSLGVDEKGKSVRIYLHRFILGIVDPKVLVDHKDYNGLNCQKENLRIAADGQNPWNARISKSHKTESKYKGVTLYKSHGRVIGYKYNICKKGEKFSERGFETEDEAGRAYDKKAKELFGEYAYLNFPDEQES